MWGLTVGSMGGITLAGYVLEMTGLIVSLIILGASIVLCATHIKARQKKVDKNIGFIWTILGAVILSAIILYIVFRWRILFLPGVLLHLALYLSLWSGISALISGLFMIYIHGSPTARELIAKKDLDLSRRNHKSWKWSSFRGSYEENSDCPDCQLARTHSYDTCPSCGKKLK